MQREMTNGIRSFRDLTAWQKAMDLVTQVYKLTSQLPDTERFGLLTQMRRCAVSIPSNIAEGWGRRTARDYLRYLQMACGSTHELEAQADICSRLHYFGSWCDIQADAQEVGHIINGLITVIEARQ